MFFSGLAGNVESNEWMSWLLERHWEFSWQNFWQCDNRMRFKKCHPVGIKEKRSSVEMSILYGRNLELTFCYQL